MAQSFILQPLLASNYVGRTFSGGPGESQLQTMGALKQLLNRGPSTEASEILQEGRRRDLRVIVAGSQHSFPGLSSSVSAVCSKDFAIIPLSFIESPVPSSGPRDPPQAKGESRSVPGAAVEGGDAATDTAAASNAHGDSTGAGIAALRVRASRLASPSSLAPAAVLLEGCHVALSATAAAPLYSHCTALLHEFCRHTPFRSPAAFNSEEREMASSNAACASSASGSTSANSSSRLNPGGAAGGRRPSGGGSSAEDAPCLPPSFSRALVLINADHATAWRIRCTGDCFGAQRVPYSNSSATDCRPSSAKLANPSAHIKTPPPGKQSARQAGRGHDPALRGTHAPNVLLLTQPL